MMNLPSEFISNIQHTFGEAGHTFLNELPDRIAEASARWHLTEVQPAPTLSYNFVAFAKRGAEDVVLKMGVPNREMDSEMAALKLFNGEGACRLLECDEEKYWMLLERLNPGEMLVTLKDDDEATRIAADVMKKIWKPLESNSSLLGIGQHTLSGTRAVRLQSFIRLSDWFDGLKRLRNMFNGGTGPLDEKLVARAEQSVKDFFIENHKPVLMHGDFHHYNILSSERGWLIIDPKGVIGPAGYEVGPLMTNPWNSFSDESSFRWRAKRRIDILHEQLGFERERLREWSLAHSILSAWWGIEDNTGFEYSLQCARSFASL